MDSYVFCRWHYTERLWQETASATDSLLG